MCLPGRQDAKASEPHLARVIKDALGKVTLSHAVSAPPCFLCHLPST